MRGTRYAGSDTTRALRPVHPRLCGEHAWKRRKPLCCSGSSPPVRGTHGRRVSRSAGGRFIPACAGNATRACRSQTNSAVHPRLCGERTIVNQGPHSPTGSSPPVRGTPHRHRGARTRRRFIPACAGNANSPSQPSAGKTVHPRLCGERSLMRCLVKPKRGSSPPVRGTQQAGVRRVVGVRFIPACAGNASDQSTPLPSTTVHPRLCGERNCNFPLILSVCGSSPPVRGTRCRSPYPQLPLRFIPACAGNAKFTLLSGRSAAVHPRLCGERQRMSIENRFQFGSSPPVRGTQCRR